MRIGHDPSKDLPLKSNCNNTRLNLAIPGSRIPLSLGLTRRLRRQIVASGADIGNFAIDATDRALGKNSI